MSDTKTDNKDLYQMALECASMPVKAGMKTINGTAVIAIISYARTLRDVTENERTAIVGAAFDIYAAAVNGTV